jgi:hypothetical protein
MVREVNGTESVGNGAVGASLRSLHESFHGENVAVGSADTEEDEGEESDGDFELDTMGDDDEDDDDDDDDDEEDELEEEERTDSQYGGHILGHLDTDTDADGLRDELMALAAAAADDGSGVGDDTIAHRTRTKLSLVDVEMDSLESLLPPDPMDSSLLIGGENEYQRFLSSLLPTGDGEDNLSFLDEEDEEYRPDEEEEEEDEEERKERRRRADTTGSEGDVVRSGSGEFEEEEDEEDEDEDHDKQTLRVSKRELTELLWDSTQIKVPPTFARPTAGDGRTSASTSATTRPAVGEAAQVTVAAGKDQGDEAANAAHEALEELKDAAAVKDLNGSVSAQQCIQLASQMHKHFQLLLQTFHMIATNDGPPPVKEDKAERVAAPQDAQLIQTAAQVKKDQLDECTAMLRELQIRGKRALEYKAQVLSKITMNNSNGSGSAKAAASSERLGERRVTRSISAAHAAVAHPSMFDIVGSQATEELTKVFERGCSVADRNQKLQKSMLELDKHILLNRKKRRGSAPRKIVFLAAEDRLLLQGVKRYGVEQDAWAEIRKTLLPTKEVHVLNKRFRYLASKKKRAGGKEFKEFNNESHSRKKGIWMVEEDVRLVRGVIEYFGANRRFARISSKYLPHRGRLEIRKRWERLKEQYRTEDGAVKEFDESLPPPTAMTREFASAVKAFLEGKLRQKLIETPAATTTAPVNKQTLSRKTKSGNAAKTIAREPVKNPVAVEPSSCSVKNLHPALFFSSWAVIHPAMLLEQTCEHNWPAFIGEKRKDVSSESTLDLVSRAAASRVEEEAATHRTVLVSSSERLEPIREDQEEDDEELASSGVEFSLDTVESGEEDDGNGDEEDSDFEHDELLSSDADESDSEYERMELSDDDDNQEEDDGDNDSIDEGEASHGEGDSRPGTQPAQVKHTLRLENLREPGGTRAMRALEALERRITGDQPSAADHTTGFTSLPLDSSQYEPLAANEAPFNDVDLLAYEELSASGSSEGDDGSEYEQDELPSSDDDFGNDASEDVAVAADRSKRLREAAGAQPVKRPKLQQVEGRCDDCGSSPCVCASVRMQRLLARIQPPG